MAQTSQEFFTDAITRSGSINATSLARKLDVDPTSISQWKLGKSYPSDKTMLKIALLCDLDPVEALALLNLWRCDEAAKDTYTRLLHVAQSTALRCLPFIVATCFAFQATFQNPNENSALETSARVEISHNVSLYHHYAIFRRTARRLSRAIRRLFGAIFAPLNLGVVT